MIRMILRPSSLSLGDVTVSAARTGRYEVGVGGKNSGSDEGLFIAGAWEGNCASDKRQARQRRQEAL